MPHVSAAINETFGGLARVTLSFLNDDGTEAHEPITVHVEDKGGSEIVIRAACLKARENLPESETERRELLTAKIYES